MVSTSWKILMAFFKRRDIGRVYVIKMVLPDQSVIHKIGMTNSDRATDRMMEILRIFLEKYPLTTTLKIEKGFKKIAEKIQEQERRKG